MRTCSKDSTAKRCAELSKFSYEDPFSDPADESPEEVDAADETADEDEAEEEADEYDDDEQLASELFDRGDGGGDTNPASD